MHSHATTVPVNNMITGSAQAETTTSSGTGVLEKTKTRRQKTPGDNERYAHYVRRDRVAESVITGRPVIALCGKVWVPKGDPTGYPVCPKCKEIAAHLYSSGGSSWPFG